MNNRLMDYLPPKYRNSRQMNALMEVVEKYMPDVEKDLWKSFFLNMQREANPLSQKLWMEELGVSTLDELFNKLSVNARLSKEYLDSKGIGSHETFRDMPEAGVILSEDGVLADGHEFMPLTTILSEDIDNLDFVKKLIKSIGLSGFSYLFSTSLKESVELEKPKIKDSQGKHLGITLEDGFDDCLSGESKPVNTSQGVVLENSFEVNRRPRWSYNILFNNKLVRFSDKVSYTQRSNVVRAIISMLEVKPKSLIEFSKMRLNHKVELNVESSALHENVKVYLGINYANAEKNARWDIIHPFGDRDYYYTDDVQFRQYNRIRIYR